MQRLADNASNETYRCSPSEAVEFGRQLGRRAHRKPNHSAKPQVDGMLGAAAVALLLLASCGGCTSTSTASVSPLRLSSELKLMAERNEMREAVEADPFPEAGEDGI